MSYGTNAVAPAQPQQVKKSLVVFAGVVSKDPEMFTTPNGNTGCNVDFAVDRIGKETHWGRATIWGTDAYIANDYCTKGKIISGTARFYQEAWENNGKTGINNKYDVASLSISTSDILKIVDDKIAAALAPATASVATPAPVAPVAPVAPPLAPVAPVEAEPTLDITSDDLPF